MSPLTVVDALVDERVDEDEHQQHDRQHEQRVEAERAVDTRGNGNGHEERGFRTDRQSTMNETQRGVHSTQHGTHKRCRTKVRT
jgi:hypothetical protein